MTKVRLLALLAVVALVLFPAIAFAQGGLQPPCAFHGTAQVNGANVADGTIITATIGNDTFTATTTNSTYRVVIAQAEGKSYAGLTVTFMIGSNTAGQTGAWQMGGNVVLNLTQGSPVVTPTGGTITQVIVTSLAAGATPTVSYNSTTGVLTVGIPAGAPGTNGTNGINGTNGAIGATGPAGKNASSVLGIVAIILAVIAIIVAVVAMMRKPQEIYSTGPRGDTGSTGPKGDTGYTGSKGDTGYTGSKGDKGDTGHR
jgi:collagen type VII alpha